MKTIRSLFGLLCIAILLLGAGGCYHIGTIGHPQIKTIAIAKVINETTAYNVSAEMRNVLAEQFMLDGTLKVVSPEKADCILYVRVTEIAFSEVTYRSYEQRDQMFVPDEWQARLKAEYSVVIPGRKTPLVSRREVSGTANFQAPGDMDSHRRRGIQQAGRDAARTIVEFTTEAW